MAGHPLSLVEDLDDSPAEAGIDFLADQAEGDGIPGAIDLDMVIRSDAGALPSRAKT